MGTDRTEQQPSERRRVATCLVFGTAVAVVLAPFGPWELALLVGWSTAAVVFTWAVWYRLAGADAATTKVTSTAEDDSRNAARGLIAGAAVTSLVGVLFGLARASDSSTGMKVGLTIVSLLAVVLSWVVIQTVFALRYAHLYYGEVEGGVTFPGDDTPTYGDFAYLAFTVGMTYQVADTDITHRTMRRTLLIHALLSYVYGAVIIAVAINLTAGFVGN